MTGQLFYCRLTNRNEIRLLFSIQSWESLFFIQGEIYRKQGRYKEAIANYNRALQYIPDSPVYYGGRGLAYVLQGKYTRAISDFDRAIVSFLSSSYFWKWQEPLVSGL